jgi:aminocarboxymuconate-semialdehyde decarboxylase
VPVIDVHTHVVPGPIIELIRHSQIGLPLSIELGRGERRLAHEAGYSFPLRPEFSDVGAKLEAMDRQGIDIAVLSAAPSLFCYALPPGDAVEFAQAVNDAIAEMVAACPERFVGLCTVPAQDPDGAVAELERATSVHHFRGVVLGATVEGKPLGQARLVGLLERCRDLQVLAFVHPYYVGDRAGFERYYLTNLIGNPLESALMFAHLAFSGDVDRLAGLKLLVAHGGGFTPYQIGRLVRGHQVRREAREGTRSSPLGLLRTMFFDSLTFNDAALAFLVRLVGADHIALGTDTPFDMADSHAVKRLSRVPGLSARERESIAWRTAAGLLGVSEVTRNGQSN